MSEFPDKNAATYMRRDDPKGAWHMRSEDDVETLYYYLQQRCEEQMRHNPDGALAEAMEFYGLDPSWLAIEVPLHSDADFLLEGFRVDIDLPVWLGRFKAGASFRAIFSTLQNEITSLPKNGLEAIERYAGEIDKRVERIQSIPRENGENKTPYTLTEIGKDTRYGDYTITYTFPDARCTKRSECMKHAQYIRKKIHFAIDDTLFERFAIDTSPTNPWTVRLHRYRLDYIRRFKYLFRQLEHLNGVHILEADREVPDGYEQHDDDDFLVLASEITRDFPEATLLELHGRLQEMLEDYQKIILSIYELKQEFDEDVDHPDLEKDCDKPEGVTVEIHKKSK
ncbi:MAG: hypothetical protein KC680_02760 [Candidatus Peregrinibacteria bacterium]|nr:hypothetical protein [Candidatus Peregrinibacteria bacterium]MCB9808550.1 hypothetical protein [Candidatus Peribacteria bacterium]